MTQIQHWLGGAVLAGCLTLGNLGGVVVAAQAVPAAVSEGYTLLQRGWVQDAIAAFQQALRQAPNSLEARLGLAIAYQRAGQDANAWQAYQRVLAQDPKNRTALAAVGVLGGYRSEWQAQGIEALTTLLQLTPNDPKARAQRALLLGYQGRFAESLADYEPLLAANPSPDVLLGAAQIYAYSSNYARSLTVFERYRATGRPIPDAAVTAYALALRESGNAAQAIQLLTARVEQHPTLDAPAINLRTALAQAYAANGQIELAQTVLKPLQGNAQAQLPLARALSAIARKTGDAQSYQAAIALYRQVLQQAANPAPGLVLEVADVMSEWPTTRAEALPLYQQLAQQQPNRPSLRVKQLIVMDQLGQLSQADLRQQLETTLQPLPDSAVERQAIAIALTRLDRPAPALLPLYQALLQSGVDAPFLQFRIAQMQVQQGDLTAATQSLATYRKTPAGAQDVAIELLLADIERREAKLDASAQRYEALIASNLPLPVQEDALWGLATVRRSQERLADVAPLYDRLLANHPNDARAQIGAVAINYQLQRLSETDADAQLAQWLEAHSPLQPYPELVSLVGALPPNPKRESLYNTLLALDPGNSAIERRLIQVIAMRDPAAARSRVAQLIASDRTRIDSYFVQGDLAQTLGDLPLASESYTAILQQQPDNADALTALAGVRFQQKRYEEAETLYKRVLVLRPHDRETQRILADLYLAQDHPTAAFHQLQQIQAASPQDATIADRIQEIQLNFLRRRGFQPYWERY